jgi:hypothetical protein
VSRSDKILVGCFALFALTSLVMEPYFVFGIDYQRHDPFAAGWRFYSQFDPAFLDRPMWLRIICAIDLFVFGPFYLVLIYAFVKQRSWIRIPALLYVSAIVYSTVLYFAWEFINERDRANLWVVVAVNIPYTLVPLWLARRVAPPDPFEVGHEARATIAS